MCVCVFWFVFVPVPYCLDYFSFVVLSEVCGRVMLQLCSFSSGFLGNSGSSVLPINFRIICSGSVKNVIGNLIGIALNL